MEGSDPTFPVRHTTHSVEIKVSSSALCCIDFCNFCWIFFVLFGMLNTRNYGRQFPGNCCVSFLGSKSFAEFDVWFLEVWRVQFFCLVIMTGRENGHFRKQLSRPFSRKFCFLPPPYFLCLIIATWIGFIAGYGNTGWQHGDNIAG